MAITHPKLALIAAMLVLCDPSNVGRSTLYGAHLSTKPTFENKSLLPERRFTSFQTEVVVISNAERAQRWLMPAIFLASVVVGAGLATLAIN